MDLRFRVGTVHSELLRLSRECDDEQLTING